MDPVDNLFDEIREEDEEISRLKTLESEIEEDVMAPLVAEHLEEKRWELSLDLH